MGSIIPILFFIVLFLLFAIKKEYVEILVTLIILLILDFTIVKAFSNAPFLGAIVVSVGKPFINILLYPVVKLIVMGGYYWLLQKNGAIAIIGYLLINILINQFYITISGNLFIDLIVNAIIAGIILVIYNKTDYLEDLKWFAIIAMIIDFVLQILIGLIVFA